jgi:DNA-binding winged helix-turn-helix (wHTH) protein
MPAFDPDGAQNVLPRAGRPSARGFTFGPYRLEPTSRVLLRNGEPVDLSPRQFTILHELVRHRGEVVSKEQLMKAAWDGRIVSDSSIEKMLSTLRTVLDARNRAGYIVNHSRQGYRVVAPVVLSQPTPDIDAVLEPHRAFLEGRALLEAFDPGRIPDAITTFERLVAMDSACAIFHVGLANACAMQFDTTRASAEPDIKVLRLAETHARRACELDPQLAEAFATLGFVLERLRDRVAASALRRAVALEPDSWRHHLRLASASWGEERAHAARQALKYWPGLPAAHWLIATVFVARNVRTVAHREIDAGLLTFDDPVVAARSPAVPLLWLKGLLNLADGAKAEGMAALDREIASERVYRLYARECAAQAWYARGAVYYLDGNHDQARVAFGEALSRAPRHEMARAAMRLLDGDRNSDDGLRATGDGSGGADLSVERAMDRAVMLVDAGDDAGAARLVGAALKAAPSGNAGWLIPVDPLLKVQHHPEVWAGILAKLAARAGIWLSPEEESS